MRHITGPCCNFTMPGTAVASVSEAQRMHSRAAGHSPQPGRWTVVPGFSFASTSVPLICLIWNRQQGVA